MSNCFMNILTFLVYLQALECFLLSVREEMNLWNTVGDMFTVRESIHNFESSGYRFIFYDGKL